MHQNLSGNRETKDDKVQYTALLGLLITRTVEKVKATSKPAVTQIFTIQNNAGLITEINLLSTFDIWTCGAVSHL